MATDTLAVLKDVKRFLIERDFDAEIYNFDWLTSHTDMLCFDNISVFLVEGKFMVTKNSWHMGSYKTHKIAELKEFLIFLSCIRSS